MSETTTSGPVDEPAAKPVAERKAELLELFRARRGTRRKEPEGGSGEQRASGGRIGYPKQFLRLRAAGEAEEDEAPATDAVAEEQVRELVAAVRQKRRGGDSKHPLEPAAEGDEDAPTLPPERRRELLAEIATEQFRNNMREWFASIEPERELSATTLPELQRLQREAAYRSKLLKAMLSSTERELDVLELQIRAHHRREGAGAGEEKA